MANEVTCIYCRSTGPYTDEHVVPAGMGGDDKGWLLRDIVCAVCNTKAFSPLEAKVMRASPLAIARLFFQTRSRDRGAKTATPSIQAPVSYFDDPDSGLLLEQELGSKGQSKVYPQVSFVPPDRMTVSATDVGPANALIKELGTLADALTICEKSRDGLEVRFRLTPLTWDGAEYGVGDPTGVATAPRDAIWLEPLERPATDATGMLPSRVFRRFKGPLVCRAEGHEAAASLLTLIRDNHRKLVVPADTAAVNTETPGIHFRQIMDPAAYDRVLTKIGINLCAHLFGADAVRATAFDAAREYARYGAGGVAQVPIEQAKSVTAALPRLPHHHLMVVSVDPPSAGQAGRVVVFMQFYGGIVHAYLIAEGGSVPSSLEPIFVVVDYEANAITRL